MDAGDVGELTNPLYTKLTIDELIELKKQSPVEEIDQNFDCMGETG